MDSLVSTQFVEFDSISDIEFEVVHRSVFQLLLGCKIDGLVEVVHQVLQIHFFVVTLLVVSLLSVLVIFVDIF